MDLLARLSDLDPEEHFGELALQRGRHYLREERLFYVETRTRERDRLEATCFAHGSGRQTYVVSLTLSMSYGQLRMTTSCSCPVGRDCKHAAALFLAIRPEPAPEPVTWQQEFAALAEAVGTLAQEPGEASVALSFAAESRFRSEQPQLTLRPLRPGARQQWVRSGLGWTDVPREVLGTRYRADHLDVLRRLHNGLIASGKAWYLANQNPALADFGPSLVALLRAAREVGITFLSAGDLPPVELADQPVTLGIDVTEQGNLARIDLGVAFADQVWTRETCTPLGDPAHTVALRSPSAFVLAELERPVGGPALRAWQRVDPILVPATGVEELTALLPALTRSVPVLSSDGSIEVPERPTPRLRIAVTWDDATRAAVRAEWVYGSLPPFAVGTEAGPLVPRDPAAELAILDRLDPPLVREPVVEAGEALQLGTLALPAWRASEGVEVIETGAPTFRETDAVPEFSFEAPVADDDLSDKPRDWLDLEVMITVEGQQVPLAHVLEALTRDQEFVVLPTGLYLRTDRPEFERLADVVRAAADLHEREGDQLRVGRGDLGVWALLGDIGVVDTQAREWVARAQALRDLVDLPQPDPTGVVSTLRSYQLDGFHWLAFLWQHGLGGILADDMGLGKTLQVLALIAHTRAEDDRPFLVVAPTSVVSTWASEAARHAPGLRVRTVESTRARRTTSVAALAADADIVVTSYTLLRLDQDEYAGIAWAGLVLDEAQQVKNHQSKAYAAVRMVEASFRIAVTGTPFENRMLELWSLLSIVTPGLYPSPKSFLDNVVHPIEREGDKASLRRLTARIRPFVLRRTKELVAADLPPKQEQVLTVELNARHRRIYDTHLAKERQRILGLVEDDFDRNRVAILAALTRLRQLALDPALLDEEHDKVGSAKIDALIDHLIECAAEGHRALVFSQFTRFLDRVRRRLQQEGIDFAYLDGATTRRGQVIDSWRESAAPVFLISLKAGGTGLTLTEADYVFVLDPWWNPAAEAQAVDRSHRIGQQRTVMVYRLVSHDTIEDKVMALKDRKAKLFAQVVDGESGLAAGITAADIRGLFS